jgi:3-hydroxyanthranilate 3,4-dioxygenase
MEVPRPEGTLDGFQWYCENCSNMLYEEKMQVGDIVKDLPSVMEKFYANEELRTCKNCGTVLEPPK